MNYVGRSRNSGFYLGRGQQAQFARDRTQPAAVTNGTRGLSDSERDLLAKRSPQNLVVLPVPADRVGAIRRGAANQLIRDGVMRELNRRYDPNYKCQVIDYQLTPLGDAIITAHRVGRYGE